MVSTSSFGGCPPEASPPPSQTPPVSTLLPICCSETRRSRYVRQRLTEKSPTRSAQEDDEQEPPRCAAHLATARTSGSAHLNVGRGRAPKEQLNGCKCVGLERSNPPHSSGTTQKRPPHLSIVAVTGGGLAGHIFHSGTPRHTEVPGHFVDGHDLSTLFTHLERARGRTK